MRRYTKLGHTHISLQVVSQNIAFKHERAL